MRVCKFEENKTGSPCTICENPAERKLVTGYIEGSTGQLNGHPYCNQCLIDIHQLIEDELHNTGYHEQRWWHNVLNRWRKEISSTTNNGLIVALKRCPDEHDRAVSFIEFWVYEGIWDPWELIEPREGSCRADIMEAYAIITREGPPFKIPQTNESALVLEGAKKLLEHFAFKE